MPQSDSDSLEQSLQDQLEVLAKSPDLQRIYFNGFINVLGNGDITVYLKQNNQPVAQLNMSYTVAKTLSRKLGELVAVLEERTGNEIMTTDDIAQVLKGAPDEP